MSVTRIAVCLLVLSVSAAVCRAGCSEADEVRYGTDWLTPPVELSDELRNVCAIDLEIAEQVNQWVGSVTVYSGIPTYDQFGDADKSLLESKKFTVRFRELTIVPDEPPFPTAPNPSYSLYEPDSGTPLACLRLVLNTGDAADCRLQLKNDKGSIERVLPLQSPQLEQQAARYPISSQFDMNLKSDLFLGDENRLNYIRIFTHQEQLYWEHDHNHLSLDASGNITGSTLMAAARLMLVFTDLLLPDPSGQKRTIYRCDLKGNEFSDKKRRDGKPAVYESHFLVLSPVIGGWHRLILMKQGQVDRILPMHSPRFRSWLRLKSQITDATEKNVLENLSKESPLFSGLRLENNHVVAASISLPSDTERILDHLVELPHLATLNIMGDLTDGAPLERLKQLKSIGFSGGAVSQSVFKHIGQNAKLTNLSFYTARIDCRGLKHLSGLRELTHFSVTQGEHGDFAENYDDSCVDVFAALPKIQYLELYSLPLTATAIERLPVSARLEYVGFGVSAPVQAVLNYAKSNPHIRIQIAGVAWHLAKGTIQMPSTATDADLEHLQAIDGLHTLRLDSSRLITDKGLANLAALKLKTLSLNHNQHISNAGMSELAKIRTLESLNLWHCENLTDGAIEAFEQMPNLREITVWGTKINPQKLQQALPNCELLR